MHIWFEILAANYPFSCAFVEAGDWDLILVVNCLSYSLEIHFANDFNNKNLQGRCQKEKGMQPNVPSEIHTSAIPLRFALKISNPAGMENPGMMQRSLSMDLLLLAYIVSHHHHPC